MLYTVNSLYYLTMKYPNVKSQFVIKIFWSMFLKVAGLPRIISASGGLISGGAVASWLVCSTPERAVLVRALAGDIVLCSWARHFTPTVPLSTQVYEWVPANLMLRVTLRWTSIPSRGEQKYSQLLHATETGISSSLMGYLARIQTFFYT